MKRSLLCFLLVLCAICICSAQSNTDEEMEIDFPDYDEYDEDEVDLSDEVPGTVTLTAYKNKRIGNKFEYKYAISDGTVHRAKGTIKNLNGTRLIIVKGHYKWSFGNGLFLSVKYEADENGLRVTKIDTYDGDRNITTKSIPNILG